MVGIAEASNPLAQVAIQHIVTCVEDMKHKRIASGKPIDDNGDEARGQGGRASDSHFPGRGIGKKRHLAAVSW